MNKIWLIIKREYLGRVRKKSFLVMTILGPLLLASIMIIPTYLANQNQEKRIIAVSYENSDITSQLIDSEYINFSFIPKLETENLKNNMFRDVILLNFKIQSLCSINFIPFFFELLNC